MDTTNAPQIVELFSKSITFTPFETRWIPCSARFVLLGQTPKAKGIMQIYQLKEGKMDLVKEYEKENGLKTATFGSSSISQRDIAVGDFKGFLNIYDIETGKEKYKVQAHKQIINSIDGIGSAGPEYGSEELVTGSRDGAVKVWDKRQDSPVLSLEPAESEKILPDCWTVW
jgi:WD40 repeat protein